MGDSAVWHALRTHPADWRMRARCYGRTDLDWYSEKPTAIDECKLVCSACPVRTACALEAVRLRDPWGIWGGCTPDEREKLAAEWGMPGPRVMPSHGTDARYVKHGCRCAHCRAAHSEYNRLRRSRQADDYGGDHGERRSTY